MMYPLRYVPTGHIFIDATDDCDLVIDAMLETDYSEEFCLANDFTDAFVRQLMEAGFLVMSMELKHEDSGEGKRSKKAKHFYILLPKLHLVRSALFFPDLHIKKSIRRFLSQYELRVDTDFDFIIDKCVQIHGPDWLTPPLVRILKSIHRDSADTRPVSFAVYREGELKAGEIGVIVGQVYTSYSGYYEEDNAGTVQMILMTRWLEENGFAFLDLGMPLDYKTDLGAKDITPDRFVELFRAGRGHFD
jgi:Leu/Phe-tRNA-protein transferase